MKQTYKEQLKSIGARVNNITASQLEEMTNKEVELLAEETLQMLIDKAMPVEPNMYDQANIFCPNCGETVCDTYNSKYCGECGQAIDWSK